MPVQKYKEHAVTNEGSMGLNVTDDPLKVKVFQVFLRIQLKEWTYNKEKFLLGGSFFIYRNRRTI